MIFNVHMILTISYGPYGQYPHYRYIIYDIIYIIFSPIPNRLYYLKSLVYSPVYIKSSVHKLG